MSHRFAIYFAPAATHDLWQRATAWLGRDALSGQTGRTGALPLSGERLDAITPSANRYGFHATIKAPMKLAAGQDRQKLEAALTAFAKANGPVDVGPVAVRSLDGFLAVVPVDQPQALTDFVQNVVEAFEPFRAPLAQDDRDKRANGLSERQIELLDTFGYPYVMEQFRFHMTLTNRLPAEERAEVLEAASAFFAPALPERLLLDRLVLFAEPEPGAPFIRLADYPLSPEVAVSAP